jgi:hypothetical protein
MMKKLNVGCGRSPISGWINLDSVAQPDVDIVADLETCGDHPLPLADDSINEFLLSHVLVRIRNVLPMMQELHRVAAPNALMTVRVPYGSSDDAFEDPTHVRPFFVGSLGYFSQPYYWRADYGYRGDWLTESITLNLRPGLGRISEAELWNRVERERNVVREMVATLRAVKPIREPLRDLQKVPTVTLQR